MIDARRRTRGSTGGGPVLAALSLSTFLYVTTETLPIGLLPQMAQGVGVPVSAVGLLVTAYALVVVVATIPLTRLTRRVARRRLLIALLGLYALATAASALASNYPALLGARVGVALTQAVFWAVVTPAAAALFPADRRGRVVSVLFAGSSLAPLVGVPAGTWLGQQTGWRVSFLVLSGLGLVILAVVARLMPDVPAGQNGADHGTAPDRGRYRVLVVTTTLAVTGAFASFTYITPFLTEVTGFAESSVGPVLLARGVAGLAGVVLAGLLVDRHGWSTMTVLIGVQAGALAGQFVFATSTWATVVATSVSSLALAGMAAALGGRVLQVAPRSTDMAAAGTSTAFNVGIMAGALVGSVLLSGGVRTTALAGAVLSLVAFGVALTEPTMGRRAGRLTRRSG
ncbi:MFS transporter [Jidongwangia harbinensis]|uniref:MFS transporter n=1 Tax=Jidongwangia harbinensis TaxID=2878561 RepID=UPI001CD91981|nr:MFS transporter [Jidongwangia harbinensis]MCA2216614.1 MFS transporter [Jidongwangia harbinensis]